MQLTNVQAVSEENNTTYRSILALASVGVNHLQVMYSMFLSDHKAKFYLQSLAEKGFLEYDSGLKVYTTTEKGFDYLLEPGIDV